MDALSTTFAALADPTRRAILARLANGDAPVGELARPFPISGPAISRHLRVLERAGLVERAVNARWRVCSLRGEPLRAVHDWLTEYARFWEHSLDQLAALLEAPQHGAGPVPAPPPGAQPAAAPAAPPPVSPTTSARPTARRGVRRPAPHRQSGGSR